MIRMPGAKARLSKLRIAMFDRYRFCQWTDRKSTLKEGAAGFILWHCFAWVIALFHLAKITRERLHGVMSN
jgi:hypothetical protein